MIGPGPYLNGGIKMCWDLCCPPSCHSCCDHNCDPRKNILPPDVCQKCDGDIHCIVAEMPSPPGSNDDCKCDDNNNQFHRLAPFIAPTRLAYHMQGRAQICDPDPGQIGPPPVPGSSAPFSTIGNVNAIYGGHGLTALSNVWIYCEETGVSLQTTCSGARFYLDSSGLKHYDILAGPSSEGATGSSGTNTGTSTTCVAGSNFTVTVTFS